MHLFNGDRPIVQCCSVNREVVDRTPADGFPAREVSDVHKGVVERGKDVRNAEHQLAVPHLE